MQGEYYIPPGGLPGQNEAADDRAVFTTAYAFIPRRVLTDIVASFLPDWHATRLWVLARPMTGFAETFSHYLMDVSPGGGNSHSGGNARCGGNARPDDDPHPDDDPPDDDPRAEHILFITGGVGQIEIDGAIDGVMATQTHPLAPGGYLYLPPGTGWRLTNTGAGRLVFHWFRKRYRPAPGLPPPPILITSDQETAPTPMPDTKGAWATSRFVDPADMSHDMHVNIVSFRPGGVIPFAETHVMEHGIYVLCGTADYRLNEDVIKVEAGDYMWLRAFCPQSCVATGSGAFRYLLYKDVNRHMPLDLG